MAIPSGPAAVSPPQPIVTGTSYLKLPRNEHTWIVEDLLPSGGGMLLYGDPKAGKSFAALQLAGALSVGKSWLGFAVPHPVKSVYVQLDTPRTLWAERIEDLLQSGHPLSDVYFADRESLNTHPFNIENPEHFRMLSEALTTVKPGVVFIDTLKESHGSEENDSTAMQKVISALEAAVKPAALVLISHSRKGNPQVGYDLMSDNRGSSYVTGRMDAIIKFSKHGAKYTSRVLEEETLPLHRQNDGTWALSEDARPHHAEMLLRENQGMPVRELARLLSAKTKRSESSCESYLRRLLRQKPTRGV